MKRLWVLLALGLYLVTPLLVGCSGQTSQESAREQIEQHRDAFSDPEEDAAEEAEAERDD